MSMGEYNNKKSIMKKFCITILFLASLATSTLILSSYSEYKRNSFIIIPLNTPFPQTGKIDVYKYKMFEKVKIGEVQWTASIEHKSGSSVISLSMNNTTGSFVPVTFWLQGIGGSLSYDLKPKDVTIVEETRADVVTGLASASDEITVDY